MDKCEQQINRHLLMPVERPMTILPRLCGIPGIRSTDLLDELTSKYFVAVARNSDNVLDKQIFAGADYYTSNRIMAKFKEVTGKEGRQYVYIGRSFCLIAFLVEMELSVDNRAEINSAHAASGV
ncbi:hypothetical protein CONLIGDRAFT_679857 [Coniochaeta ligniaria NRRL 30616]|uniref:Uncharacterized protein n=1 Tax=Coniochaeta ligniaria NRRL 30616 TaxID=1408157 RepID=A0A1J7JP55_9PEZI|nr:hypothetical protein CONLIGDRAFT_679857 [Coniochaeta ligniaria NRRL 30616]